MSWASYEDYMAEVPVITPDPVFCIECEAKEPVPGHDHCQSCLDNLNEAAAERVSESYYGGGSPMTLQEQHKQAWRLKRGLV